MPPIPDRIVLRTGETEEEDLKPHTQEDPVPERELCEYGHLRKAWSGQGRLPGGGATIGRGRASQVQRCEVAL